MQRNEVCLVTRQAKENPLFGVSWYFPNTYAVGMSGLGYQLVWSLIDKDPEVVVNRGFSDMEESGAASNELFGFTVSWELDFINILAILEKHGIAYCSTDRSDDSPLVFGGGPVLSANPEPFADFFDVVLLGDAEAIVPNFINAWKTARELPGRQAKLQQLATIPGVYVPSLYSHTYSSNDGPIESIQTLSVVPTKITKQLYVPPPDYMAHTQILSPDTAWGDTFLAEIVRSCPQECRFCLASFLTRPFRPINVDTIMNKIDIGLQHTNKIGLLGPSVTEHPHFDELAARLSQRDNIQISVASIRADTISDTVLQMLRKLNQKSVTIAIESGSERLRAIMKKNLSEEEICHAVDLIEASGLESVKFYGIVGLPHETQDDLNETVRLMQSLKKKHRRLRFVFGVSSFVPKAQTPYQWNGRSKDCKARLEYIRKHLAKVGIEVRPESHNWSDIQAVISRGDRRLTEPLIEVAKEGGSLGAWKKIFRQQKEFPMLDFYAFRQIPETEILPWEHLTENTRTEYLQKHQVAAAQLALTLNP
ncbi:MAG: radical SAM protein [Candidatus Melainabacteria bacterium]|nr:MAG: radical SAM protein [Candidatus Melainabacteria bacterium]